MGTADNILIIRTSAIGDVVFASALIGALRGRYPDARLSWLVEPGNAPLLQQHPDLHEIILWPKAEWKQLWRARRFGQLWRRVRGFRRELRNRGFDLVLDLQGLMKSGLLAWFTHAPRRVGLGSREGSRWLMTRVIPRAGESDRIGSEYRYLAEQLGLATDAFEMCVALGADDDSFVDALAAETGLDEGYLVVCPFTTRPQKHWFDDRWHALLDELARRYRLPIVVLGGPGDRARAEALVARSDGRAINMAGSTSLTEAAALIRRCRLLVGVDTGLTHMGTAFAVPTLALFGATCPYTDTGRDNARVIYHSFACSPCRRSPTCDGEFFCMQAITVDEVLTAAERLPVLDEPPAATSAGGD